MPSFNLHMRKSTPKTASSSVDAQPNASKSSNDTSSHRFSRLSRKRNMLHIPVLAKAEKQLNAKMQPWLSEYVTTDNMQTLQQQNQTLLKHIEDYKQLGAPVLLGDSIEKQQQRLKLQKQIAKHIIDLLKASKPQASSPQINEDVYYLAQAGKFTDDKINIFALEDNENIPYASALVNLFVSINTPEKLNTTLQMNKKLAALILKQREPHFLNALRAYSGHAAPVDENITLSIQDALRMVPNQDKSIHNTNAIIGKNKWFEGFAFTGCAAAVVTGVTVGACTHGMVKDAIETDTIDKRVGGISSGKGWYTATESPNPEYDKFSWSNRNKNFNGVSYDPTTKKTYIVSQKSTYVEQNLNGSDDKGKPKVAASNNGSKIDGGVNRRDDGSSINPNTEASAESKNLHRVEIYEAKYYNQETGKWYRLDYARGGYNYNDEIYVEIDIKTNKDIPNAPKINAKVDLYGDGTADDASPAAKKMLKIHTSISYSNGNGDYYVDDSGKVYKKEVITVYEEIDPKTGKIVPKGNTIDSTIDKYGDGTADDDNPAAKTLINGERYYIDKKTGKAYSIQEKTLPSNNYMDDSYNALTVQEIDLTTGKPKGDSRVVYQQNPTPANIKDATHVYDKGTGERLGSMHGREGDYEGLLAGTAAKAGGAAFGVAALTTIVAGFTIRIGIYKGLTSLRRHYILNGDKNIEFSENVNVNNVDNHPLAGGTIVVPYANNNANNDNHIDNENVAAAAENANAPENLAQNNIANLVANFELQALVEEDEIQPDPRFN